jgi:hypothetical protein
MTPYETEYLARLSCEINSGKWPTDLGWRPTSFTRSLRWYQRLLYPLFRGWHEREVAHNAAIAAMCVVDAVVPRKETLRYWNTTHRSDDGRMTDAEFETWWASRSEVGNA